MELTESFIQQVTPPPTGPDGKGAQAFYRDSHLIGFALRVSSGGTKSYILERRIRGKVKRITLGRCDELEFSRAQARAKKLIREVERENAPHIIHGKIVDEDLTLSNAYHAYITQHNNLTALTRADYQRSIDGPLSEWLATPVKDISSSMIMDKHKSYEKTAPARSNNAMRLLRAVLNYVRWNMKTSDFRTILRHNPVDILSKKDLWYPSNTTGNKAGISKENIKHWWNASQKLKKSTTRDYFYFLLFSGLPPKIVSTLKFTDFDFDNKTINCIDPQTKLSVTLPISKYLSDLIYQRPDKVFADSTYVFHGLTKGVPISNPATAIKRITANSGIKFGLKDLFITFLQLASLAGYDANDLNLLKNLHKTNNTALDKESINKIREIQERVFLSLHFIISL